MPAVKSACPRCRARLELPTGAPATLLCPTCGHRVTVTAAGTVLAPPEPSPTLPMTRLDQPAMGVLVPDRPRRAPAAPPPAAARPAPPPDTTRHPRPHVRLAFGMGVLSVLVVAGCVWAVVAHVRSRPGQETLAEGETAPPQPGPLAPGSEPTAAPKPAAAAAAPAEEPRPKKDPLAGYVPRPAGGVAKAAAGETAWEGGLSAADQQRVNQAIDRGVAFLKRRWGNGGAFLNRPGGLALGGLTLLACGVPSDDRVVKEVITRLRSQLDGETRTYDLALGILCLDRLGDPKDRDLIRTLALRLVAGQNAAGGWSYECRMVRDRETEDFVDLLRSLPPPGQGGRVADPGTPNLRIQPEGERAREAGADSSPARARPGDRHRLREELKNLPVVKYRPGAKLPAAEGRGGGDNSNTQFAVMAVWAARKYDLPMDRTLALVEARFRASQNEDGSWGYLLDSRARPDSMTCAGLLGLAVGRGILRDSEARRGSVHDPDIARGLRYLGKHVGTSGRAAKREGQIVGAAALGDLYFLWSVERVAVAYDLRRIDGKEWYSWGARLLVEHQQGDGSWQDRHPAVADTCFALLFLKRANVAEDLTATLRGIGPAEQRGGGAPTGRVGPK